MNDIELEEKVKDNPMFWNSIFPVLIVASSMCVMTIGMFLISWFLYIHSF